MARSTALRPIGAAVYGAYFAVHVWLVRSQILPGYPQPISWLAMSGLPFVVRDDAVDGVALPASPVGIRDCVRCGDARVVVT